MVIICAFIELWRHERHQCDTHSLFAPRAADGNDLFTVERKLLLEALKAKKEKLVSTSVQLKMQSRCLGQLLLVSETIISTPSHTVCICLLVVSDAPSDGEPQWAEHTQKTQQNSTNMSVYSCDCTMIQLQQQV